MGQRSSVLIGIGIPIALVIGLFTWGVIQNDGAAGRPGVNEKFGETKLSTQPFSDFNLTALDGDFISIKDYRGKIVVVDSGLHGALPVEPKVQFLANPIKHGGSGGLSSLESRYGTTSIQSKSSSIRTI